MKIIPRTLGGRLKELREERQLTQVDVAKALGIQQSKWSRYENDDVKRFDPDFLEKVANFFQVPTDYLTKRFDELDHLPEEVQEFVKNPAYAEYVVKAYFDYIQRKINRG